MADIVHSPYGPREIDCTGDPACWPWNRSKVAPSTGGLETAAHAAARLNVRIQSLRDAARNRGHQPWAERGRPPKGSSVGLPSAVWDECAAAHLAGRKRSGPKPVAVVGRAA